MSITRLNINLPSAYNNIVVFLFQVDPTLYGDNKTRLFIHYQVTCLLSTMIISISRS